MYNVIKKATKMIGRSYVKNSKTKKEYHQTEEMSQNEYKPKEQHTSVRHAIAIMVVADTKL